MNNRNNYAIPALMLVAIPTVMIGYYIVKWAFSSGFIDWLERGAMEAGKHLFNIAIEIMQKAFV
jgi:hypothetical protein